MTDERTNKTKSYVTLNVSIETKNALDRKHGSYIAKYGKDITLIDFTAIQLNVGLEMDIDQIHAIHVAKSERIATD